MAWIFCSKDAAIPIKSYGPEVITLPFLQTSQKFPSSPLLVVSIPYFSKSESGATLESIVSDIKGWIERLHVLVVGPGLGRDSFIQEITKEVLLISRNAGVSLVLDAVGFCLFGIKLTLRMGFNCLRKTRLF